MEMIHVIYLTIIALLVAAGFWLLNQLRKVVDEKIEKEEQLDRISKAAFELFEYANSDEKNTAYELGKWERSNGTVIEGLKLYNEAYVEPYRSDVELMHKVALDRQKMWIKLFEDDDNENEYNGLFNKAFCIELIEEYKKRVHNPLKKELEAIKKVLENRNKTLEQYENDTNRLWKAYKQEKSEVEALEKQVERLKAETQEAETLKSKLQSAYGRIGALTQQVSRLKKECEKKAAKVEVKKVELPKECPEHLFKVFPEKIRQMAWEAMCSAKKVMAQRAYEKKNCYSLFRAFPWRKTEQGYEFWWAWYKWYKKGANPNNMPPTDPDDPIYK